MTNRALIIGVSGQDGVYLAKHLLAQGYEVIGLSRDAETGSFHGLSTMGIKKQITLDSISASDFRSVAHVFQRYQPNEVYNLAGQSSVGLSFNQPVETIDSHLQATITILEVIKFLGKDIKFYNACSSECFGEVDANQPANEEFPFRPRSPYALGKAASFWAVANYREAYGLFACSGILGNHESPLRPERFVTQKVIRTVAKIAEGKAKGLVLGNTGVIRDWGWAEDYVQAMNLMLLQDNAEDFVIATGESHPLMQFVKLAFEYFDLEYSQYLKVEKSLFRPSDIKSSYLNPTKANEVLGWKASHNLSSVVEKLAQNITI